MTTALRELAEGYIEAAARLRLGLEEARGRLERAAPEERAVLEADMRLLRQMLAETREVGELVGHYYEPGYWRNRRYTL